MTNYSPSKVKAYTVRLNKIRLDALLDDHIDS